MFVHLGIVSQYTAAVAGMLPGQLEFFANLGAAIFRLQFTRGQEGVFPERFGYFYAGGFQRVMSVALRLAGKVGIDLATQLGIDKGFDLCATGVKDTVQTEVQLRLVELEELAQQGDKLVFLLAHVDFSKMGQA